MADWSAIDLEDDPTPGDVPSIQSLGERVQEYAAFTREHTTRLGEIANIGDQMSMQGDYAPIYRAHLRELHEDAGVLEPAHTTCANALSGYARTLEQCQLQSRAALEQGTEMLYQRNT